MADKILPTGVVTMRQIKPRDFQHGLNLLHIILGADFTQADDIRLSTREELDNRGL